VRRTLAALILLALAGIGVRPAAAEDGCPGEAQGFRRLETADAAIAYRWEPADLKVGQFFAVEVVACRVSGGAAPVGQIAVDATMPAHGHGMSYLPKAERVATGRWRFTGLMLHMPGTWQLTFDLVQGGKRTRLTYEVNLKR
jgi:hypothetical protein